MPKQNEQNPIKDQGMKKLILILLTVTMYNPNANSAVGIYGSYVGFNLNSLSTEVWYGAQEWGNDRQNLQGANIGTFNWNTSPNSLILNKFTVQTFKSGGGDVTGASLLYRVYQQGTTPGSFNTVSGNFLNNSPFTGVQGTTATGAGDQNWGRDPIANASSSLANVNLLTGISVTTQTTFNLEIYFQATSNEGTQFSNNGGANYIATFNAIPEPSSASLMALGMAGLLALRRRRKT